jgi:DMSO reductase family type II enzyme chaperone
VYQFISPAFSYPDKAIVELLKGHLLDAENRLLLLEDRPSIEALRALTPVITSCSPNELESEYLRAFGHTISKECPPYEAEYDQAHIFQKSHALADIAGFYRAFGLELGPDFKDRLDHISVELEFMHFLCLKEAYALDKGHTEEQLAVCREAQAKFLGEHLGLWVFAFAERLDKKATGRLYELMAHLLSAFLTFEMRSLGLEPGKVRGLGVLEPLEQEPLDCEACPLVIPSVK